MWNGKQDKTVNLKICLYFWGPPVFPNVLTSFSLIKKVNVDDVILTNKFWMRNSSLYTSHYPQLYLDLDFVRHY